MTEPATSTDPQPTMLPHSFGSSWKSTLWLIVVSVTAVLALQVWSSRSIVNSTSDLRAVLSQAHATANKLEQKIGYGGLIHNFKNYVLRPDEDSYRVSAFADATQALSLLEQLQHGALEIGIDAKLDNTHNMLESYAQRLALVRELSEKGLSSQAIDELVRFDDRPALQEVERVMQKLDIAVDDRLRELHDKGTATSLLSTVSTAALGLLLIGVVAGRQRRHVEALGAFTERLTSSNTDLAAANTSLRQFAGIVSHDLKSPVRYIHMFNRMIAEDAGDAPAVEQHVDDIDQQVQHMDLIIDSLLEFTKVGFSKPALEDVAINHVFADIEERLITDTNENSAFIEFNSQLETLVLADAALVTRVIDILIGNSLKYVSEDASVKISVCAETDDKQALVSVTDNGIGIEPRYATSIFEPMTRLHGPHSRYKGVGIGLSLAKSIVENHGGLIWLDTEFTQGTRIVFSLPLSQFVDQKKAA